ncbi:MAG: hypothetical protein ACO3PJ_04470 [Burkholderiaceae bacterium]|jgi:hypothetical protein
MSYNAIRKNGKSYARDGHTLGDFAKRTSIGDGKRKRGSFKGKKKYRGQGR